MTLKVSAFEKKRVVILSLFLLALFCSLILQFYKLQILEGEKWKFEALKQHHHVVVEPFMRGRFFSNTSIKKGHPEAPQAFVMDIPKFHLYADPESLPPKIKEKICSFLTTKFLLSETKKQKVFQDLSKKSRSRKLLSWLDKEDKESIEAWWQILAKDQKLVRNALFFVQEYKRSYPFGSLLGQVIHTLQDEKDPKTFQQLPTGGLELYFHDYVKGKSGKRLILRSSRHALDVGTVIDQPEHGADVYLTINHYLQAIAEEELKKGVENVNAKGGWAVMMDPNTGEILALAQYPFFDLSNYRKYFNDPKMQEQTKVRAVCDAYEPGSSFKPITLSLALQANEILKQKGKTPLFSPEEKVATSSGYFPGRGNFPLTDGRKHNFLNMYMGIQKSSNVYVGKIVQRMIEQMGDKWYKSSLEEVFGFGKKTAIELPGETAGLVPTPGKIHPNGKLEWSLGTPYSLGIGHNIMVNSMQMLRAFSTIINGGMSVQPTLVKKIVKQLPDGREKVLFDHSQIQQRDKRRVLNKNICDELIRAMRFVTKSGGTSPRGDIPGYSEGGKSGTSEKIVEGKYSKQLYLSFFVGFAPAKNPKFVLLVAIDEPEVRFVPYVGKSYHGGVCASPVFREIGRRTLEYLGVEPDDPFGYPVGDPRRSSEKAEWSLEVKKLSDLYQQWNVKK
jgi:cell division protein FtsI (penicillin-binding protein 3)